MALATLLVLPSTSALRIWVGNANVMVAGIPTVWYGSEKIFLNFSLLNQPSGKLNSFCDEELSYHWHRDHWIVNSESA
jgi:hypothetical protein